MPTGSADLEVGETVYLIRRGKRIFAVRAALVEPNEIHDEDVRAEAKATLKKARSAVAVRRIQEPEPDAHAKAQKTFVDLD